MAERHANLYQLWQRNIRPRLSRSQNEQVIERDRLRAYINYSFQIRDIFPDRLHQWKNTVHYFAELFTRNCLLTRVKHVAVAVDVGVTEEGKMCDSEDNRQAARENLQPAREHLHAIKQQLAQEPAVQAAVQTIAQALVAQKATVNTGPFGSSQPVPGNVADKLFEIAKAINHLANVLQRD